MSELISGQLITGKEALIALANGEEVEFYHNNCWSWVGEMIIIKHFVDDVFEFRLKPRTIMINGIEVVAPFKPVEGDTFYYLSTEDECGYDYKSFVGRYPYFDGNKIKFGAWHTEDEIKQVVDVLRSVFEIK